MTSTTSFLAAPTSALDIPDMSGDPRFATLPSQIEHKPLLQQTFRERYKTNTTSYWLDRLEAQDLLCAPVRSLREALTDAQTHHNGMIIEGDCVKVPPPAIVFPRASR